MACKTATACWVQPGAPSNTTDMPRLTRGEFGWSVGGMATVEVIQNERLILKD